jgi:hypothetical protein
VNFSTSGSVEGFLRVIQGDLTGVLGLILFIIVAALLVRWLLGLGQGEDGLSAKDVQDARRLTRSLALWIVLFALIGFSWRMVVLASVNYMPHADIDKSSVYEQMNSNIKR